MAQAQSDYILYGWQLSYYSGKARTYMRFKDLPLKEREMSLPDFRRIKKHTGSTVMPAIKGPDGAWLQDTAHIIDVLEARHPERSVTPVDPVQNVAAHLLETWFDEAWIPAAMHYRWAHAENYDLFQREGGDALLPFMPRFVKNYMIAKSAAMLKNYLPGVGVVPDQVAAIEAATNASLDHLDAHFARHAWLSGPRPSMADFGLAGPIFGHLGRDPWPKQYLMASRPHLVDWLARISHPDITALPDWPAALPDSLEPLFATIAEEFVPKCLAAGEHLAAIAATRPANGRLPRGLDEVVTPLGGSPFRHRPGVFVLWKIQRLQNLVRAMPDADQLQVRDWATGTGIVPLLDMTLPRLQRRGLHVKLAA